MIFNNNPTMSAIPMAEGYDSSTGCAMALIESAKSDYAMFEAMLKVEARAVRFESADSNYVNEADYMALQEATIANIWAKIKELFESLIAKIKAIFTSFSSKLVGLFAKDKTLVKKYRGIIRGKSNIGNMELKNFRKVKNSPAADTSVFAISLDVGHIESEWDENADKRITKFLGRVQGVDDCEKDEFESKYMEYFFDSSKETVKVSEIGGIDKIISYMDGIEKIKSTINTKSTKLVAKLKENVKTAKKEYDRTAGSDKSSDEDIAKASKFYDCSKACQEAMLLVNRVYLNAIKLEYKQNKAAFMKAIAANDKKLEESAEYLDAVQFVTEAEVTDVLDKAISGEDLSDVNVASKSVMDGGVSDDPDFLTYDDDCYTEHPQKKTVDGSVDTEINSKSESAFFGELLY